MHIGSVLQCQQSQNTGTAAQIEHHTAFGNVAVQPTRIGRLVLLAEIVSEILGTFPDFAATCEAKPNNASQLKYPRSVTSIRSSKYMKMENRLQRIIKHENHKIRLGNMVWLKVRFHFVACSMLIDSPRARRWLCKCENVEFIRGMPREFGSKLVHIQNGFVQITEHGRKLHSKRLCVK